MKLPRLDAAKLPPRIFFAGVYFVGAIVLLADAAEQLADALAELFVEAVISVDNVTEGKPDAD